MRGRWLQFVDCSAYGGGGVACRGVVEWGAE